MALAKPEESPVENARQPFIMREGKNSLCPIRAFPSDHPEPWYKPLISTASAHNKFRMSFVLSQALHQYVGTPGTLPGVLIDTVKRYEWRIQVQNTYYSFHACVYGLPRWRVL